MANFYLNSSIELYALKRAGQVAHRVSLARSAVVSVNKAGLFSFYYVEYTSYTSKTHISNAHIRCILLLYRMSGNTPYTWNVMSGHTSRGVCLERMHRTFSELVVLAQRYNPVETGPRKVSILLDQLSTAVPLSADVNRFFVLFTRGGQRDALTLVWSPHKR